jgi:pimeloyl-ACP methyl ester carboxylesterase
MTATEEPTETTTMTATEEPTETASPSATATEEVIAAASPVATEAVTEIASPAETGVSSPIAASPVAASPVAASPVSPSPVAASPVAASPTAASPVASEFPSGPLGEQAAWTWSILSNGGGTVPVSEIESHLSPEIRTQVLAGHISGVVVRLQENYGPFTLVPESTLVAENEPPTSLTYEIAGQDDVRFQVAVSVNPATGLINDFTISPASASGTPVAVVLPAGMTDTDVSFTSGADTLYGSFLAPDSLSAAGAAPAALIISGSGSADRNGNSPGISANTTLNLAITLAQEGIPSLRYDKLGSGQTGPGSHTEPSGVDYELFLQEARDAAAFLSQQPGVDPGKLILVGHSEGALFALVLAKELTDAGTPPAAVILAAPLSERYLDALHEQLTGKIEAAVTAQTLTQDDADKITAELDSSIDRLRTTGTLPMTLQDPGLAQIFSQANAPFLSQIDKIDPSEVAAGLPPDLPVLVLLGFKDAQVTGDQVRHLMDGFREAGNDNAHLGSLPKADHTLRIIEGAADPAADYANPDLEFSPQAVAEIEAFLKEHGLTQGT